MIEQIGEPRSFETRYGSRVAIVGGGMLGTTLALRYRQAGRIVTLFESAERVDRRGHASISSRDRFLSVMLNQLDLAKSVRWDAASAFGARFGALAGGRGRILEALRDRARAIDVDIRLGTPVREIFTDGSGFIIGSDGETGEFDQVVLTVPSPIAARLMPALPAAERIALMDVDYTGIITVSFVLERRPGERYLSRVSRGADQFALLDPSALIPSSDNRNVVYVTRPLAAREKLFEADDRRVIEDFARAIPGKSHIVNARVIRMPHAFAPRQLHSFTGSIPGLSIVNAAHMADGRHHLERTAALAMMAFRTLCSERVL